MKLNTQFTKVIALIVSIGLMIPNPAYAARPVAVGAARSETRAGSTWGDLVSALTGPLGVAGVGAGLVGARAETRSGARSEVREPINPFLTDVFDQVRKVGK